MILIEKCVRSSLFMFFILISINNCFALKWQQADTVLFDLPYYDQLNSRYFIHMIAVLRKDFKLAYSDKFKDSKSEFDDSAIVHSLSDSLEKETQEILSKIYLMDYSVSFNSYDFKRKGFELTYNGAEYRDTTDFSSKSKFPYICISPDWITPKSYVKGLKLYSYRVSFGPTSYNLGYFLSAPDTTIARPLAEWSQNSKANLGQSFSLISFRFTGDRYRLKNRQLDLLPIIPIDVYILNTDYSLVHRFRFNPFLK
jgi:hypothetical protein